jgi:hypothetical protein
VLLFSVIWRESSGSVQETNEHGCVCRSSSRRLAYAIMLRTREELIEIHKTVDHDHVDQMMGGKRKRASASYRMMGGVVSIAQIEQDGTAGAGNRTSVL